MERVIQAVDFIENDNVHTVEVGKKFKGTKVVDIIEHDGDVFLYNSKDELIALIDLPIFGVRYSYPSLVGGEIDEAKIEEMVVAHT